MTNEYRVEAADGTIRILDKASYDEYLVMKNERDFWDQKQAVRKVYLNSVYGALLNEFFRFSDKRLGQSTTLSGRVVVKHLIKQTNYEILGKYEFGKSIIYSDTDSVYFTLHDIMPEDAPVDDVVKFVDETCKRVNASFPDAMAAAFFVPKERNKITIARELVCRRGLFKDKKKRYALNVIDKEGIRENSMTIKGMDTKRAELPEMIRSFLKDLLIGVVRDGQKAEWARKLIEEFKVRFRKTDPWLLGRFSSVSDMDKGRNLRRQFERGEIANPRLHYAVIAADNTNRYLDYFKDRTIDYIRSGDKIAIFDIRKNSPRNPLEFQSIAIPLGAQVIPQWLKDMPFDMDTMEMKFVDKKVDVTIGALGWNLKSNETAADQVFG